MSSGSKIAGFSLSHDTEFTKSYGVYLFDVPMDNHVTFDKLQEGLAEISQAPKNHGNIELLVIRPVQYERKVVNEITMHPITGCEGDIWHSKKTSSTPDGKPNPERQVTLINSRVLALLEGAKDTWPKAGDQVYVDMDLSKENLPAGTDLSLGSAIIRVSAQPHNGCKKFAERYGIDATRFVNSSLGKAKSLRGINCYIVKEGIVKMGDTVSIL
jgi:hypothetical protein